MDPISLDQIQLNFDSDKLWTLNVIIGVMMFGMALDLKVEDFKRVVRDPKGPAIGLTSQFILLPALTFLLTIVLRPAPSIALGMMMVAACPGGNLSNLMTYLAGGNPVLSVSMTAISTFAAIFMTPLNLALWGGLNPATAPILRQVSLSPSEVFKTVVMILGIPLVAGMIVSRLLPSLVDRVRTPFKVLSVLVFLTFVAVALSANWDIFLEVIGAVVFAVALHNALALSLGFYTAKLFKLPDRDARAVSIEVGIQNTALGLVLIFGFFKGLGGMAIVAAWWGIWHIISGLSLGFVWSRKKVEGAAAQTA